MWIVVPVKAVATLDEDFALSADATAVDADWLEWSLNEWDAFSLEAAVQLAEQHGGEVVVVSVGDEDAHDAMLVCLAAGAARGLRVWGDELAGADALAVARVLAAAVARLDADLVLCGVQSSDDAGGATGVALAAHLGLAHVAVVRAIALDAASGSLTVERELEGGTVELLRLGLPALLTVQTGINQPRYATLRAIKQAADKPVEVLTPADLGLDAAALAAARGARLRRLRVPAPSGGAEMLAGSIADVADRIAGILRERTAA